jgi:hypothetical protein
MHTVKLDIFPLNSKQACGTHVRPVFRLIPANSAVMRMASNPTWNSLPNSVILLGGNRCSWQEI